MFYCSSSVVLHSSCKSSGLARARHERGAAGAERVPSEGEARRFAGRVQDRARRAIKQKIQPPLPVQIFQSPEKRYFLAIYAKKVATFSRTRSSDVRFVPARAIFHGTKKNKCEKILFIFQILCKNMYILT